MKDSHNKGLEKFRDSWLKPGEAKFIATAGGFLNMEYQGELYKRIAVYRAFPLKYPNLYISLRQATEKAEEIAIIQDLEEFSAEEQELINAQLRMRYFTPKISKINKIKEEFGYSYWDVKTDTALVKFVVRMGDSSINRLSAGRYIINDIDGNRFEIEDSSKLSMNEQKQLDLYI